MRIIDRIKGLTAVWILKGMDRETLRRKMVAKFLMKKWEQLGGENMKNWKTTSAGIGSILVSLGGLLKGFSSNNMELVGASITGIITGIGLILANDAKPNSGPKNEMGS